MSGLLLRLAGPLQSWGERSAFSPSRDTAAFPTRSGLIGMFAAAEGRSRNDDIGDYTGLEFTVRIDRPGTSLEDFHTAGGGLPKHLTAATSGGDHKGDAVITRRRYLADAVFVVAVAGPRDDLARIADALEQPHWNPYLGRRSCPPDEPLVLRVHVEDPVRELRTRVPLSATYDQRSHEQHGTVAVDFVWERYDRDQLPQDAVTVSLNDIPLSYAPHSRSHGKRRVHRTTEHLPAQLCADLRADAGTLHEQLIDYALENA